MTGIFIAILSILIVLMIVFSVILTLKTGKERKIRTIETLQDVLDSKAFYPKKIIVVNRHLSLAVNKSMTKIAVVENFNPNNPEQFNYFEIALAFVEEIKKSGQSLYLNYVKNAEKKTLFIHPQNKENREFLYRIFKAANIKKIEEKFPACNFSITSASDWENSYVWAFAPLKNTFAYLKCGPKPVFQKFNLKKVHFTIDTGYNYFEAPILGEAQQLFLYENNFLNELFVSVFQSIKQNLTAVFENKIYFDSYNNIVYLSNGTTSLQSLILDRVEEVIYENNRLRFALFSEKRMINFPANAEFIKEFEDFITGYNLRKIANNFDYKTDKLINTTPSTKFIIDTSRDRLIYCANLATFSKFSYLTIAFDNLEDAFVEKSGASYFVRIFTKDDGVIDVSCAKNEVAHYILAQIQTILNK